VPDLWTDLVACLDIAPDAEAGTFEGRNQQLEYHRVFGGWLLLRQHSPLLAHGRCFGRGDVLTEDGALVASYGQEALLRFAN
jgi:acyl-CoA thioesterase